MVKQFFRCIYAINIYAINAAICPLNCWTFHADNCASIFTASRRR